MVIARDCSKRSRKQRDIEIAVQLVFLEELDALYAYERT